MELKAYPYIYTSGDPDYRKFVMQDFSYNLLNEWFEKEVPNTIPTNNMDILDDFISYCYRRKIDLYWNEKILTKFSYSMISSPNGSAEYYQSAMRELDKPQPLIPREYNNLIAEGYVPSTPYIELYESKCDSCNHKGLSYFPMSKFNEDSSVESYIAYSICPICRKETKIETL